jgi:hypothetical protein
MFGYEFYWCDPIEGYKFIGALPERRRDPKRITHRSILDLGRILVGKKAEARSIFFIQIRMDEAKCKTLGPIRLSATKEGPEEQINTELPWSFRRIRNGFGRD